MFGVGLTDRADPAGRVDFTHDPLSDEVGVVWGLVNDADEFMARYSLKVHIALDQLQVRGANARLDDPNDGFAVGRHRGGVLIAIFQAGT